jgi:hypothetical protein
VINIAIIHGIGINKENFADDLVGEVKTQFNNLIELELHKHADYSKDLIFHPIAWDVLLGDRQKGLAEKIRLNLAKFAKPLSGNWWDKFSGFALSYVNQILKGDFAAQFIMDIISYGDSSTRQMIFDLIQQELSKLPATDAPVSMIAHSLGTVIAADFTRDKNLCLANFFTMGSPIELFAFQYGKQEFKKPVICEKSFGRWINILDQDDPIGYRLQEISNEYKALDYLKDCEVDCGVYGQAHIGYWSDKNVQRIIASKLALDWLRFTKNISDEEFLKRLITFDNSLAKSY